MAGRRETDASVVIPKWNGLYILNLLKREHRVRWSEEPGFGLPAAAFSRKPILNLTITSFCFPLDGFKVSYHVGVFLFVLARKSFRRWGLQVSVYLELSQYVVQLEIKLLKDYRLAIFKWLRFNAVTRNHGRLIVLSMRLGGISFHTLTTWTRHHYTSNT